MRPSFRLIATDLDGTITGGNNELTLYAELRKRIDHLRARDKAIWVVCTGRSLRSLRNATYGMRNLGLLPDFVIVKHAYVYQLRRRGYWPHVGWNLRILLRLHSNRINIREKLEEWQSLVHGMTPFVTTLHLERDRLCLRFDQDEDCSKAFNLLTEKAKAFHHLTVFRYLMEIDIRAIPFTKGLALQDLAQRLEINRDEIIAIGNGHNDISMLDGQVVGHSGCPSNARTAVMQAVNKAGGHIARKPILAGTIDVLDAHLQGRVDSSLPDTLRDTAETRNPHTREWMPHTPGRKTHKTKMRHSVLLTIAVIYVLLTVFASFDMLPFSRLFMYPFTLLDRLFAYLS